jgi:ribosome maturation factor RimP
MTTAASHRTVDRLTELVDPVCADCGYELVDVQFTQSPQGPVVRVFIDYPEGSDKGISFEECESISRELSALFDVEDPIESAYRLEVSSPGLDRPLRKPEHFRRFVGEEAKISLRHGVDGRRNFRGRVLGVESEGNDSIVTVEVDGTEYRLPLADLATANLVPNWDALMKGSAKG